MTLLLTMPRYISSVNEKINFANQTEVSWYYPNTYQRETYEIQQLYDQLFFMRKFAQNPSCQNFYLLCSSCSPLCSYYAPTWMLLWKPCCINVLLHISLYFIVLYWSIQKHGSHECLGQTNTGVQQHCKVIKYLCRMQKGLI